MLHLRKGALPKLLCNAVHIPMKLTTMLIAGMLALPAAGWSAAESAGSEGREAWSATKRTAHKTGDVLEKGARRTGDAMERVAKTVGRGVVRGARTAGDTLEPVGEKVGRGMKKTGRTVARGAKRAGETIEDGLAPVGKGLRGKSASGL